MANSLDLFIGILLTVIGLVLVYGSIAYRLIDLILILGVLITIFGLYKLLKSFYSRISSSSKGKNKNKLGGKSKNDTYSIVKEGAKEVENIVNSKLDKKPSSKLDNKSNSKSVLETHDEYYSDDSLEEPTATLDEFLKNSKPKEPAPKIETPIDESKQVLKTKPVKEEKSKFKLPSIRKSNKTKKRSFGYLKEDQEESNPDTVYFTPNYEKPMKVTRRPKKKAKETINLSNAPKRSREISKALASVGDAETVYDNEVSEESYSLIPKTIDEEIIMPIDEIDLDEIVEGPIYNLSQSENTLYNNVIYDESGVDDVITPIYADEEYREEHGITDDDLEEYDDFDSEYTGEENMVTEDQLDYITPEVERDEDDLNRPTSIASTNPIASKKASNVNLSRPHKKSEALIAPKPKEPLSVPRPRESLSVPRPRESLGAPRPKSQVAREVPQTNGAIGAEIPRPIPKSHISTDPVEPVVDLGSDLGVSPVVDTPGETITIDPNNPESIPIPKLLNSYVICDKGILTSQEAFEEVASHSKEEILLEAPTVKDMGERFLSSLSKIKSRVIIQEFDLEDISYVLLLSSLIKKGVEIKTLPNVDSFNLIGDTSYALLISNSIDEEDFEYGAVYEDKDSVESIKELFESSWNLANDLDLTAIVENA